MSLAWTLKDELARRGRVYYGKQRGNRSMFIARRLLPHFNSLFGVPRQKESAALSTPAQDILKVLRKEWELATGDLRGASGITARPVFTKAIDELQRTFKVIPGEIVYEPKFTYIWTLAESRFQEELEIKVEKDHALREIARAYLSTAGMTFRGELARVTGLGQSQLVAGRNGLQPQIVEQSLRSP